MDDCGSEPRWEQVAELEGHSDWVLSVGWSPDGSRVVSAGYDGSVRVWDVVSGACVQVLEGHTEVVLSVGWSPDGTRLASASGDRSVRVWQQQSEIGLRQPGNGWRFRKG